MRKRLLAGLVAPIAALAAFSSASASASTEFGSGCTATNSSNPAYSIVQLGLASGAPVGIPSAGVITRWRVNLISSASVVVEQRLKIFRPTADPKTFQVIGESGVEGVAAGANSFPTRVPVAAGDRLGLTGIGVFGALICESGESGDKFGALFPADPAVGSGPGQVGEGVALLPVTAVIEPDADGDGYGDETQDKCPQSAATQAPCPTIGLSTFEIAKAGSVTLFVAADNPGPVTVSGTIKLKGKQVQLKGGTQTLVAGRITAFKLAFPAKLKAKLKELKASQKLSLKIVASATDVAGRISTAQTTAKLRGQG